MKSTKIRQLFEGSKEDDAVLLDQLAHSGLVRRYDKHNKKVAERLDYELKVINELGGTTYFLINHNMVRFANEQGF